MNDTPKEPDSPGERSSRLEIAERQSILGEKAEAKRTVKMGRKIPIVDDQAEVRELVSVTLELGRCDILTAENGKVALEVARRVLPDLVLLDVQMPGNVDGVEVCRQLKSDPDTSNFYIIMLTARGHEWDKAAGTEARCDEYFTKPFSSLQLIGKVEELLN